MIMRVCFPDDPSSSFKLNIDKSYVMSFPPKNNPIFKTYINSPIEHWLGISMLASIPIWASISTSQVFAYSRPLGLAKWSTLWLYGLHTTPSGRMNLSESKDGFWSTWRYHAVTEEYFYWHLEKELKQH